MTEENTPDLGFSNGSLSTSKPPKTEYKLVVRPEKTLENNLKEELSYEPTLEQIEYADFFVQEGLAEIVNFEGIDAHLNLTPTELDDSERKFSYLLSEVIEARENLNSLEHELQYGHPPNNTL